MHDPTVQAMMWTWATLAVMALVVRDDRRFAATAVLAMLGVLAVGGVMMMVSDVKGDVLSNCREIDGVQVVWIDNRWQCVPPGEEG